MPAVPSLEILANISSVASPLEPGCPGNGDKFRTIHQIVISCAATVWACTWMTLHLNIPPAHESALWRILRRLGITIVFIMAPELVVAWAVRQWLVARRVTKKWQEHRLYYSSNGAKYADTWTNVHSFFALMGGYVIYRPEEDSSVKEGELVVTATVLDVDKEEDFEDLFNCEDSCAAFSAQEITDKGKRDWVSKGLALLQTLNFIANCFARVRQHLPLTQAELGTCAFAILNIVIYFLWWVKPQGINEYLHVGRKLRWEVKEDGKSRPGVQVNPRPPWWRRLSWPGLNILKVIISLPVFSALDMLSPVTPIARKGIQKSDTHVPTFFTGETGSFPDAPTLTLFTCACALISGGVNAIAWNFIFPTNTERDVWRYCTLVILSIPPAEIIWWFWIRPHDFFEFKSFWAYLRMIWHIPAAIGSAAYIIARLILISLSVTALRDPPSEILTTTSWTAIIPHII
ncbi:hypothetical protein NEOLEDRAFT_1151991 [Neolentinus lepideus HHB14362 ss-1]|uniref:Uncharacterized protein n=1 Tax=Neolentinus lepideus HHB14362 ss-1 TaxID=1314782 RepID=A0A165NBX6_9AGAM|nr:hypothetical protein NEOLEDRAFT_1151991 [Neolentinus lepideus HHB14362 ss-1]